jgi:manganese/zinc/iron transport system permease protein
MLLSDASASWHDLWRTMSWQLPFHSNTAIVLRGTGVLGLACGVIGAFLLLRKRSLVADALSHAALPGVCVGFMLAVGLGMQAKSLAVLIPAAGVFGLLGVMCVHLLAKVPRVKEDAAIGAVLSVFFALGVVLLGVIQNMQVPNKAGLNHFIFGQAAAMSSFDSTLIGALAVAVIGAALLMFKELKLLCFDRSYAGSLGWPVVVLDGILLAMVTTLTVIGLHAVGAILMVALLIIPPAAARFWTDRLGAMMAISAAIGAVSCHIGTSLSAVADDLPTGPAIVIACGSMFMFSMVAAPKRGLASAWIQRMRLGRIVARQHLLRAMYEHGEISGEVGAIARMEDLLRRRSWSIRLLQRNIKRLLRKGEVIQAHGGCSLTPAGRAAAATIVRTHRIWEHFLTTQADIAPSHVDRAADDIEHVLSDELIRDLEEELRIKGALPRGTLVPRSPHQLGGAAPT